MLERLGCAAIAVDYGGVAGPGWYGGAAARIAAALPGDGPFMLALHSGAGAFAPSLAAALGKRAAGFLFVDALLPHPGKCWLDTAPPALAMRLRKIVEHGVLPPWVDWFGPGVLDALVPDPALRTAFSAELPRLPFAYLEAVAPIDEVWETLPSAYLQLSEGYAAEAVEAARRGWPLRRERLHHLAMLTHPDRLAPILAEMMQELASA